VILPLRFDLKQASHNTDAKNTKDWNFRNAPSFVANNIAGERNGSGSRAEIPSSGCMADLTVQNLGWSPPQTPGRPKAGLEISCRSPTSEPSRARRNGMSARIVRGGSGQEARREPQAFAAGALDIDIYRSFNSLFLARAAHPSWLLQPTPVYPNFHNCESRQRGSRRGARGMVLAGNPPGTTICPYTCYDDALENLALRRRLWESCFSLGI
jgi:hypothetical protein